MHSIPYAIRRCLGYSLAALAVLAVAQQPAVAETIDGVLPDEPPAAECISNHQRAVIEAEEATFLRNNPHALEALQDVGRSVNPYLYTFWPQSGVLGKDLFISNYVDLDPTAAILDYNCGTASYDGHDGIDCAIGSFGKQEIGMPIYAVIDGVVSAANDGEDDHNTSWNGQPANYVVTRSADGRRIYYYHMRKGSVAVSVGDVVIAGQQIGQTASSGISTGPHLHFETRISNQTVEPFAGPCGINHSHFSDQPAYGTDMYLAEATLTTEDLSQWQGLPYETSRTGYVPLGTRTLHLWMLIRHFPANSTYRIRYVRPTGAVAYDSGVNTFSNSATPRRSTVRWLRNTINFNTTGNWKIEVAVNNYQFTAPLIVTGSAVPPNQPPKPISVEILNPDPLPQAVVGAAISNWQVVDDPDYDLLRYNFKWTVKGQPVRDIVTAGLSDYLPRNYATPGASIQCTVTAADGRGGVTAPAVAGTVVRRLTAATDWMLFQ